MGLTLVDTKNVNERGMTEKEVAATVAMQFMIEKNLNQEQKQLLLEWLQDDTAHQWIEDGIRNYELSEQINSSD